MVNILLTKIYILCDGYIVVNGTITIERDNDDKARNKKLIFKNNIPFTLSISKLNNTFIDNVK